MAAAPAATATTPAGTSPGPGSVGVGTSLRGRVSPAMTSLSRATAGRPASITECIGSGRPASWAETQWLSRSPRSATTSGWRSATLCCSWGSSARS